MEKWKKVGENYSGEIGIFDAVNEACAYQAHLEITRRKFQKH